MSCRTRACRSGSSMAAICISDREIHPFLLAGTLTKPPALFRDLLLHSQRYLIIVLSLLFIPRHSPYLYLCIALCVVELKMDARRLKRSGFLCMVLISMLMLVVCEDADSTSCISSLAACAPYLNATTKPDNSCCSALITIINKDSQCLCNLLHSDEVKQLGINVTKAMELPAECGKNVTASQCGKTPAAAAGSSSVGKTPSPTPPSTSASSSTTTNIKSKAAASVSVKILPVAVLVLVALVACLPVGL